MPRRHKPRTPEQIQADRVAKRAKDLEAVNLPPDAAHLPKHADIEVTRAGQKREGQRVDGNSGRRLDAFSALKDGMAQGAYDAARRFELAIMTRRGESDRGRPTERVNRTVGLTTDAMLRAADEVEAIVARIPLRDWWLLMELIAPSREYDGWRGTVTYITGETHAHAQGAVIRSACVNVRDAYVAWERKVAA